MSLFLFSNQTEKNVENGEIRSSATKLSQETTPSLRTTDFLRSSLAITIAIQGFAWSVCENIVNGALHHRAHDTAGGTGGLAIIQSWRFLAWEVRFLIGSSIDSNSNFSFFDFIWGGGDR